MRTAWILFLFAACLAHAQLVSLDVGPPIRTLNHGSWVYDLALSRDGSLLATAGQDGTVKIWETASGRLLTEIDADQNQVTGVAFHPDGMRLATSCADGTVKLWLVATGRLLAAIQAHKAAAADVTFSPDGSRIVSAGMDGTVGIWAFALGQQGFRALPYIEAGNVDVFGKPVLQMGLAGVSTVAFSRDGKWLAIGSASGRARLLDATSEKVLVEFRGHTKSLQRIAFSPDGKLLATASYDGTARIWDTSNGKELQRLRSTGWVLCVAFSPDGRRLAVGSRDHTVDVWDASTGGHLFALPKHASGVWGIKFSPSGRWLVTGTYDGTVQTWDISSMVR